MLAVPGKADIAETVYHNETTGAVGFRAQESDSGFGGGACSIAASHEIRGPFGNQQTGKIFAIAGARNGGVLIGIKTAAHQRGVADAPMIFVVDAACRSRGCEVTLVVNRHRANCAMLLCWLSDSTKLAPEEARLLICL